jgi:hypothetical protein
MSIQTIIFLSAVSSFALGLAVAFRIAARVGARRRARINKLWAEQREEMELLDALGVLEDEASRWPPKPPASDKDVEA